MVDQNKSPPLCEFGCKVLLKLLHEFSDQLPGVRHAEDPEYIHRMRVSSRRLRAAMPIFRDCFPSKEYKYWIREIRRITRALGAARDLDVHIRFLKEYQGSQCSGALSVPSGNESQITDRKGNKTRAIQAIEPSCMVFLPDQAAGIAYVLQCLEKQRESVQPRVLDALDSLEQNRVLNSMEQAFRRTGKPMKKNARKKVWKGIRAFAAASLVSALDEVLSYEEPLYQPGEKTAHHAMRIAVKQLRYRMEIFGILYGRKLTGPVRKMRRLQTLLGELHDCDVWIEMLPGLSQSLQPGSGKISGDLRGDEAVYLQVQAFTADQLRYRQVLYTHVIRYWERISQNEFFPFLHDTILAGGLETMHQGHDASVLAGNGSPGKKSRKGLK